MGFLAKIGVATTTILAIAIGLIWIRLNEVPPLPDLRSQWWGPGNPKKDESIRPFKIDVSSSAIDDLHNRLENLRKLTEPLQNVGFQYGFNSEYLMEILDFWRTKYVWKEREVFLNQFPQFKTRVDGLDLHFLRVKPKNVPKGVEVVPLLLLHGWPGSVREFYEMIPMLTTPRKGQDFVFEVIAPSLPGYGFSQGAAKPGLGAAEMAVVMNDLMARLEFNSYYVQGGDWGAIIVSHMATLFPNRILGVHSNMCFVNSPLSNIKRILGNFWPSLVVEEKYVDKVYPYGEKFANILEETGYLHIQATKPDTIGVALLDSPAGLAAYILEKFSTWTDAKFKTLADGGLTKKFTITNLLDNVMIYWITGSITTSMRLYSETFNKAEFSLGMDLIPIKVPAACAQLPNEIAFLPESLLLDKYPYLARYTVLPRGGHFAAFEEPELLAGDIWESVQAFRNFTIASKL